MPREVTDPDGITWTCIQAFSGLGKVPEKTEAARVDGEADTFQVVCAPSGGAESVRIELSGDWEQKISEEQLLDMIQAQLNQSPLFTGSAISAFRDGFLPGTSGAPGD